MRKTSQSVVQGESRAAGVYAPTRLSTQWCAAVTTYDLLTPVMCSPSMKPVFWTFSVDTITSKCQRFRSRRRRSCLEVSLSYRVLSGNRSGQSATNVSVCRTRFCQTSCRFMVEHNDTRCLHRRMKKCFMIPLLQHAGSSEWPQGL